MNILTFDIEDWFHILDNNSTKTVNEWSKYEVRIHDNLDRILLLLKKHQVKATFFCLGWIAEKYPEIITKIITNGYQIGCHSYYHQLVYEQTKFEFEKDLCNSIDLLEKISGQKITSYRAPGFSINEKTKWSFEILANNGITHDSSIFAANRGHGGYSKININKPTIIEYNGIKLKELPINYYKIIGKKFIFSGGGYFRLLPYTLIKHCSNKSDYVMTYFHPRDFDYAQPMIKELTFARKFKSYYGLKNAFTKFEKWLTEVEFIDIRNADLLIDWGKVPLVKL